MKRFLFPCLLLAALLLCAVAQPRALSPAQQRLVEAERAFAKLSVEKGVREAFLTWFADDGINFQPKPGNTREAYRKLPDGPSPITLNWAPVYGDVSAAGDLGYSTGPYVVQDRRSPNAPAEHGLFFSVWKRQEDGTWKVLVDGGVRTPGAAAQLTDPYVPAPRWAAKPAKAVNLDALDQALYETMRKRGPAAAWRAHLADSARIYRRQELPVVGPDALARWIGAQTVAPALRWAKTGLASSGDLGYSYGEVEFDAAGKRETGYYIRIWKRDANGVWRIVFDVGLPG